MTGSPIDSPPKIGAEGAKGATSGTVSALVESSSVLSVVLLCLVLAAVETTWRCCRPSYEANMASMPLRVATGDASILAPCVSDAITVVTITACPLSFSEMATATESASTPRAAAYAACTARFVAGLMSLAPLPPSKVWKTTCEPDGEGEGG